MATTYELYNSVTNNVVGAYPNKPAALAIVQRAYESRGIEGIRHLSLNVQDSRGRVRAIARGGNLLPLIAKARHHNVAVAIA
jgi:hypothetical protein